MATTPAPSATMNERPLSDAADFRAVVVTDLDDEAPWARWRALAESGVATPFQTVAFTRPLLTRLAPAFGARPLVVEVREGDSPVLSLALVQRRGWVSRRIEFADFGLTDLAAPIWRRDLDLSGRRADALRRAVLAALPPHDVMLLAKMPTDVDGAPNPLADWPGTAAMNVFTMLYDPAKRPVSDLSAVKESGRKRRKLDRDGGALRRVDDLARALELLDFAFALRAEKAERDGRRESLERPEVRAFYREVVTAGLADGSAAVWEAVLGDRTIGMVHGLAHDGRFNGTLMATVEDDGLHVYSPGMIAVATVLEHHVANGGRLFDLGVGELPYKLRFGAEPAPLVEYARPATPLGLWALADRRLRARVRGELRRRPELRARIYRLLGKA